MVALCSAEGPGRVLAWASLWPGEGDPSSPVTSSGTDPHLHAGVSVPRSPDAGGGVATPLPSARIHSMASGWSPGVPGFGSVVGGSPCWNLSAVPVAYA